MTASRAVGIMVVAGFLVELSMEAGVISLVEGGYGVIYPVEGGALLGAVKVISKAEEEEAVPLDQIRMFPHETLGGEFWASIFENIVSMIKEAQVI